MGFLKRFFLLVFPPFYIFAGAYHFVNPDFYLPLMPDYILFPEVANYFTGLIEIVLGVAFIFPGFRRLACLGMLIMLLQFIPVHLDFILMDSCVDGVICVPEWMGYARLLIVHPLLIFWVWTYRNNEEGYFKIEKLEY